MDGRPEKIDDTNVEPSYFHSMPTTLYEEFFDMDIGPHAVLDLTAGDGACAEAALHNKISYVGVCFTDRHREKLYEWLAQAVLRGMRTEGSPFYDPAFAELLHKRATTVPDPNNAPGPARGRGRGGGRGAGRGQGQAAGSREAAGAEGAGMATGSASDESSCLVLIWSFRIIRCPTIDTKAVGPGS